MKTEQDIESDSYNEVLESPMTDADRKATERRFKSSCILTLLGLLMLVMGCIVHVERKAIEQELFTENQSYTYTAANVLLCLGALFLLLSWFRAFATCCVFKKCCNGNGSLDENNDTPTCSPADTGEVYFICEGHKSQAQRFNNDQAPPLYAEIIKGDKTPPPSYYDATNINSTS